MGRSQVARNQRGRGRGGRGTTGGRGRGDDGGRGSEQGNHPTKKKSAAVVEGDNSWRFDGSYHGDAYNQQDDDDSDNEVEVMMGGGHDGGGGGGAYYGGSSHASVQLRADADVDFGSFGGDGEEKSESFFIDGMAFSKLLSTLPASTRLRLPLNVGERLDEMARGDRVNSTVQKTLAELRMDQLREDEEKLYGMQRLSQQTEKLSDEEKLQRNNKGDETKDLQQRMEEVTVQEEQQPVIHDEKNDEDADASDDEEEDLDAWLDSVIS